MVVRCVRRVSGPDSCPDLQGISTALTFMLMIGDDCMNNDDREQTADAISRWTLRELTSREVDTATVRLLAQLRANTPDPECAMRAAIADGVRYLVLSDMQVQDPGRSHDRERVAGQVHAVQPPDCGLARKLGTPLGGRRRIRP
jgi:hypothetical protein